MKFNSTKAYQGTRLECAAPFDTEFIKNVRLGFDDTIYFDYQLRDLQSRFPIGIFAAEIFVKPTGADMYAWASVHTRDNTDAVSKYVTESDGVMKEIEFEIEMAEDERKALMLFLLKKFIKNDIKDTIIS